MVRSNCRSRVAELPGACHVCGLTLVSSPHLARSYHHLFPVCAFDEVPPAEVARLAQVGRQTSATLWSHYQRGW
jgi:transcription factor Ssl1